jgi:hypothetical protein
LGRRDDLVSGEEVAQDPGNQSEKNEERTADDNLRLEFITKSVSEPRERERGGWGP